MGKGKKKGKKGGGGGDGGGGGGGDTASGGTQPQEKRAQPFEAARQPPRDQRASPSASIGGGDTPLQVSASSQGRGKPRAGPSQTGAVGGGPQQGAGRSGERYAEPRGRGQETQGARAVAPQQPQGPWRREQEAQGARAISPQQPQGAMDRGQATQGARAMSPLAASGPPQPGRGEPAKSVSPPVRGTPPPRQERSPGAQQPVQEVTAGTSKMQIAPSVQQGGFNIPPRSTRATKGRPCIVEVNHFKMDIKFKGTAYHYDVTIKPELPRRLIRQAVGTFCKQKFPNHYPAFDGRKNIYTAKELPNRSTEGMVKVYDVDRMRDIEFFVEVKFAAYVDMNALQLYLQNTQHGNGKIPQDAVQAIDVVLRHGPAFRYLPVGRSYFSPQAGRIVDLGGGFEMWYGFFQSATLGWTSYVNVDVSHKAFPKEENLVDMMKRLYGGYKGPLNDNQLADVDFRQQRNKDTITKAIKGLRIQYAVGQYKRSYRANGIVDSASRQMFDCEGVRRSVQSYWEQKFNFKLSYPHLPCVHLGARDRTIYIPSELCTVVGGQVSNKKLSDDVTASMIKHTATSTADRKRKILDAVRLMNESQDNCVRDFGISVSGAFTEVGARILNAPTLGYEAKGATAVVPIDGVWYEKKFITPKSMKNWCIISLCRMDANQLRMLGDKFRKIGHTVGMDIDPPAYTDQINIRNLDNYFEDCVKDKVSIVVVVIPDRGDIYPQVKQAAELRYGVLTQCIKERNASMGKDATIKNVCLKLNSKLGGTNHCLFSSSTPSIMKTPVIIFGADVTHPSPDVADTVPSVAAVSASLDPKAFQYAIDFRIQTSREEIIRDLKDMVMNLLKTFRAKTRQEPQRIIFFRDGVSEGQFDQVLRSELTSIRAACTALNKDYKPAITFLVVQKRHHTRLFPTKSSESVGKPQNVPPGTIVDTQITHPVNTDFYLVSHQSIQGVSRPTRYRKLWDDNKMSEDDVQELTYFLCYLFARCTRSVSYPSPTYYAHLAAYRARSYIAGREVREEDLAREQQRLKIQINIQQNNPFFFV